MRGKYGLKRMNENATLAYCISLLSLFF